MCWAPVADACCREWRMEKRIPRRSPRLADQRLRATPEQLCDTFGACTDLNPVYRRLVKLALEELRLLEDHVGPTRSSDGAATGSPSRRRAATGRRAHDS